MKPEHTLRGFITILGASVSDKSSKKKSRRNSAKDKSSNTPKAEATSAFTSSPLFRGFLTSFSPENGAECTFPSLEYDADDVPPAIDSDFFDGLFWEDDNEISSRKRTRDDPFDSNSFKQQQQQQQQQQLSHPLQDELSASLARPLHYDPKDTAEYDKVATAPHAMFRNAANVVEKLIDLRLKKYVDVLSNRSREENDNALRDVEMTLRKFEDKIARIGSGASSFAVIPHILPEIRTVERAEFEGMDDAEGGGEGEKKDDKVYDVEVTLPLTFASVMDVELKNCYGAKFALELHAPGLVTGVLTSGESSLMRSVVITLDTRSLVKSMLDQVRKVIRKAIKHIIKTEHMHSKYIQGLVFSTPSYLEDQSGFPRAAYSAYACGLKSSRRMSLDDDDDDDDDQPPVQSYHGGQTKPRLTMSQIENQLFTRRQMRRVTMDHVRSAEPQRQEERVEEKPIGRKMRRVSMGHVQAKVSNYLQQGMPLPADEFSGVRRVSMS